MLLLLISFIAGVLTVLAPCTLPLLPVIVGGSVGRKGRALTVVVSLALSIVAFTLALKASSLLINVPQSFWAIFSGSLIVVVGILSLFPSIWEKIPGMARLNIVSNKALGKGYTKKSFWGDVIIGAALGPVFSTCSPTYFVILATVLPKSFSLGLVYLFAYVLGLALVLLGIAAVGERLITRFGGITDPHGRLKMALGVLFVVVGVFIAFGWDKAVEDRISQSGFFDITKVEQKLLELNAPSAPASGTKKAGSVLLDSHVPAPEITNPSGFVNTDGKPITISQFKGKKVVLLDIWTYSCINCRRTLPYLKAWYDKYKDQGLEIIGIHTPEFAFEKVQSNVENAVKELGIEYPVVLDNDYGTWNAFGNQYWPRKYIIGLDGTIVYDHIGEGGYEETEQAIREALGLDDMAAGDAAAPKDVVAVTGKVGSPEVYFGAARNEYLANGQRQAVGDADLTIPASLVSNALYLGGVWRFDAEKAETRGPAKVAFKYSAKNVYMVASSDLPDGTTVTIKKDGKVVKNVTIKENTLYTLIEGADYGEHLLEIEIPGAGLDAFTFTFG